MASIPPREGEVVYEEYPVTLPLPIVPARCEMRIGEHRNHQGLRLQTFRFQKKPTKGYRGPKGIVNLCHGYGGHTQWEWFLPANPGETHDVYDGSLLDQLVDAGYVVITLDHQGHGRSEGARGLRCFFESYDDLAIESSEFLRKEVGADPELANLPIFLLGVSMGGCTAVKMSLLSPELYAGMVLLAPMLSLELVQEQIVACCIRNKHLAPFAAFLSRQVPTLPIAAPARNEIHPLSQKEMDEDPYTYSGSARARVAEQFLTTTQSLMGGELRKVSVPFVTFHCKNDTFTDPAGSRALFDMASTEDKTFLSVGIGQDVDEDMWHALQFEPGRDAVAARALEWIGDHTR
uniref:Serine aminopeptidase S33 domain-containing protein n=1 Tax=Phaeomonas parva TaxID=124430 RepID=A0A6U4EIK4_9STRA|mmetsp:Transcript_2112/g.6382  ORF Transcript_2112/g.6382 Transcript_2112/m.6382 type:complete len:348 (+) Transcript_2112:63-1106(+)